MKTMTLDRAKNLIGKTIKVTYKSAPEVGIRYITITCMDDYEIGVYYKMHNIGYDYIRFYKPLGELIVLE